MTKNEALFKCKNDSVSIKLDWWDDFMYIYYCNKDNVYKSGGNGIIDLDFLLPGVYEVLENKDKHLGGLFSL